MYPALVNALTRLAQTARWSSFTAALSRMAGVPFSSLKQVLEWAKNNKSAAALIAAAVIEAGMSVADFLRGEDGKPQLGSHELAKELSKYAKIGPDVIKLLNDVLGADGDRLKLSLNSKTESDEMVARCAVAYIRDNVLMAGPAGADVVLRMLELHAAMQLFANMGRSDVESLLNNRVSPVPAYDRQVMRPYLLAGM